MRVHGHQFGHHRIRVDASVLATFRGGAEEF
jgi:hypothetical protein